MINQKDIYVGLNQPSNNEPLWIKPLTDGNVALYARVYGEWIAANSHAQYYTKTEIDEFLASKVDEVQIQGGYTASRYITGTLLVDNSDQQGRVRTASYGVDGITLVDLNSNMAILQVDGVLKLNGKAIATEDNLSDKEDAMPITTATGETLSAVVGNYYRLDNVGTLAITLPTITGATKLQSVTFMLTTGTTPQITITSAGEETILYQMDITTLEPNTSYEMTALWNGSEWTLTTITYQ